MVRVPGSLGDSGFHRESLQEDAQVESGQGNEASTEIGSPLTPLKHDRYADRQSLGRSSTDGTEEGPATDLEEKPQPPPQVPSGTPAGLDANRGLPDESPPAQAGTQPPSARSTKKKPARSKSSRKKMKAPDSDADDRADLALSVTEDQVAAAYYTRELHAFLLQDDVMKLLRPKLLGDLTGPVSQPTLGSDKLDAVQTLLRLFKEVGIIAGVLDAESLFDLKLSTIQNSAQKLFLLLKQLVGESKRSSKETSRSPKTVSRSTPVAPDHPLPNPGDQTATSSPYVSATEEVDSDSVDDPPPRMTLGPSGAAMLRSRVEQAEREVTGPIREPKIATVSVRHSPEKLESFFQAAMERFLKEQQLPGTARKSQPTGDQDVEMESVGSPNRHSVSWEFDLDDFDLCRTVRAAIATTASTSTGGTGAAPRIRASAMSELKEFSGKDGDEDRARSWLSKVRSAFVRDQAPDDEKCLVFGDLLTDPARNWYRQLSRTTRTTWKDLLQSFQIQYCGRGVSVTRQYYHARKRSDKSPLEYLHRLNVTGLRTRLQVKDGPPDVRREHVEHFIETLDDRDLADQLALLRIPDVDTLEEVLRSRQRAKSRQSKTVYCSIKTRPKPPDADGTRAVRAIQVQGDISDSDSRSSGSDEEGDLRRVYAAAAGNNHGTTEHRASDQDRRLPEQDHNRQDRRPGQHSKTIDMGAPFKRCTHCGSAKHDDLGCWKRLTCEKCGKHGHPSDRCLFAKPAEKFTTKEAVRWRNSTT